MLRFLSFVVIFFATQLHAEQLFRPIPMNAGVAANGLQSSLRFVKNDFGPGESLLASWQISNVSEKPVSFSVANKGWYDVLIRIRRNGTALNLVRAIDRKEMHFTPKTFNLEPGASHSFTLDLRAIDWDDAKWCDVLGNYEVQIVLGDVQTAWTRFRVTTPGEKLPELTPEQAERMRTLITQLGDPDFARREQAHSEILQLGKAAILSLQDATANERDTEIVARCERLIQEITQPRVVVQPMLPRPPIRPVLPPPPIVRPQPPLPPPDLEF